MIPLHKLLAGSAVEIAPRLLGALFTHASAEGSVSVRLTEVEAYLGSEDPGSHAFRGPTKRNAVMFGEPGNLYTYFTYGMHVCANIVTGPPGTASGILLRAGTVVDGVELARSRRTTSTSDTDLGRGPGRLVVALGITLTDGGSSLNRPPFSLRLADVAPPCDTGPRTGVAGPGGTVDYPWRFWIPGERSVSPYRQQRPR